MEAVFEFICSHPSPQREILEHLHELLVSFPQVETKIRYKIPFYYRKSWICYLNPVKNKGIEIAFLRGNELADEEKLLSFNGRKQVAGLSLYQLADIPEPGLERLLHEAIILDDTVKYASKRKPGTSKR
ncbi:MAG: DUF1801 domain-containing protein [Bacteroidota bacterium]